LSALALAAPAEAGRTFYVDHAQGNDAADGRSAATAWKHAPGDDRAPAAIRTLVLQPGDRVLFRGGVRYRGTFQPRAAGTADNPVILDGSGWGSARAIIDGSRELTDVRRCRSADDCLGAPAWRNLWRATLPEDSHWSDWLFVDDLPLQAAPFPDLDARAAADPANFPKVPLSSLAALQAGSIRHPLPPGLERGQPVLTLWVIPNMLTHSSDIRVSTSGIEFAGARFEPDPLKPYTDRDTPFMLMNLPAMVTKPGRFALSPADRTAIFWPATASAPRDVSIGGRRHGISLSRANHLTIQGFSFAKFSGNPQSTSAGSAIRLPGRQQTGITIQHNSFLSHAGPTGASAVIFALGPRDLVIRNNQFQRLAFNDGIVIDNSEGTVSIRCNLMAGVGRTAIRFRNVRGGSIARNRIMDVNSVHGNAISVYGDSREVEVIENEVTDSMRPMTVNVASSGTWHQAGEPGILVARNRFVGSSTVNGPLTSYDAVPNLRLHDNLFVGPRLSLKLTGRESGFEARGNLLVGTVSIGNRAPILDAAANRLFDAAQAEAVLAATPRPLVGAACR
jgi:hypothetical protein